MLTHVVMVAALCAQNPDEDVQNVLSAARILPTAAIVPLRPVLSDLDADGDLDLVIGNGFLQLQPPLVEVQIRNGDGATESTVHLASPYANPFSMPRYVAAHDFDGDGLPEIVVVYSDGQIEVFRNGGAGVFGVPTRITPGFVGSATAAVSYSVLCHATADLDNDGYRELVLPFVEFQIFFPRRGTGLVILEDDGAQGIQVGYSSALNGAQAALASGDIDGDGRDDLVAVDGTAQLTIARGDGRGGFALVLTWPLDPRGLRSNHLGVGDIDGDGDLDFVVGYGFSPAFEVLENLGASTFSSRFQTLSIDPRIAVRGLAFRDFDGDRDPDLALLEAGHPADRGRLSVWRNERNTLHRGTSIDAGLMSVPNDIAADVMSSGDVDGNATPDLVISGYRNSTASVPQLGLFANLVAPPYLVEWSGTGLPGSSGRAPELHCGGGPAVLDNPGFWVELREGLPTSRTTLFLGSEPTTTYGAGGLELMLTPLHISIVDLDHSGSYRWSIPITADPALVGEWGYAQAWMSDPFAANLTGIATTRRLGVRIGRRW